MDSTSILLVARQFSQGPKGWPQNAEVTAEPAESLPAIDVDFSVKIKTEDNPSCKDERQIVGTPVTA
jgi:hypothetical protein